MNLSRTLLASGLLLALPCPAAVLTVGPGGTHTSIQSAISASQGAAGDDEIRIRAGTYTEQVLFSLGVDKVLQVSGGWNAGFDIRDEDPAATVIDGSATGLPLFALVAEGELRISNLTLRNGLGSFGGGVNLEVLGTGSTTLEDCIVRDNVASAPPAATGAGILARVSESGSVSIVRCHVHDNVVETEGSAAGGGVELRAAGNGNASLRNSLVENNTLATGTEVANGAGLYASCWETGSINITGNRIERNVVAPGAAAGDGFGAFLLAGFAGTDSCLIQARGNRFVSNDIQAAGSGFDYQLRLYAVGESQLVFGDNLVAGGIDGDGGVSASALNDGVLALVNLSIVDNEGEALSIQRAATAQLGLFNTLAFGNDSDALPLGADSSGNNLFGIDPLFTGTTGYRLSAGSPAVDAGAPAPPGGLGSVDADGGLRVVGSGVDIGAYEFGSLLVFGDGFEE